MVLLGVCNDAHVSGEVFLFGVFYDYWEEGIGYSISQEGVSRQYRS
jgi:hypothetical protein